MIQSKTDTLGILAGILCMMHCLATPFLFVAKSCVSSCCESAPRWWGLIDIGFLAVSLYAVYRSSQSSSRIMVKYGMWFSWLTLSFIITNEYVSFLSLSELAIYLPAISLVALHFYNIRTCSRLGCCTD